MFLPVKKACKSNTFFAQSQILFFPVFRKTGSFKKILDLLSIPDLQMIANDTQTPGSFNMIQGIIDKQGLGRVQPAVVQYKLKNLFAGF
jgi:hypothetical protein